MRNISSPSLPLVALVWENFGPTHADRMAATAARLVGRYRVRGVEICGKSATYGWASATATGWEKVKLFPVQAMAQVGMVARYWRSLRTCRRAASVFLCHYEHPATWLLAVTLRLFGKQVFVMNDSKADDAPRVAWREWVKRGFYAPYHGALAGSPRSRDYIASLGVSKARIMLGYDGISVARVKREAGKTKAVFAERDFLIVARLVPEKNIAMAIGAYALYWQLAQRKKQPIRKLQICGHGGLESELRKQIAELGLIKEVRLHGWVESGEIAKMMGGALALVLPSTVEPFGQVVAEAVAVGLPVLVSTPCGACDELVEDGVNGFTFAPIDVAALAEQMLELGEDELLWKRLVAGCRGFEALADTERFAQGVEMLING